MSDSKNIAKNKLSLEEENSFVRVGYKFLKQIGYGGFSKVYLTIFTDLIANKHSTKILACKVIDSTSADQIIQTKLLEREIKTLRVCHHPNIIDVFSIFNRNNKYFVFMRYAERGDLFDYLIENGALSECHCVKWTRQIAAALQYLHILDIAHRDLKCENILITKHFNAKLADFGLVKLECKDELSRTYCGSIQYSAPEIVIRKPYEPKCADMWSLGVVIFTMLNKTHPFDASSPAKLYENQIAQNWNFEANVNCTLAVRRVVKKLLEPIPTSRWTVENLLHSEWMQSHFPSEALYTSIEKSFSRL